MRSSIRIIGVWVGMMALMARAWAQPLARTPLMRDIWNYGGQSGRGIVALSPDGASVVVNNFDEPASIFAWGATQPRLTLGKRGANILGAEGANRASDFAFSPNGALLAETFFSFEQQGLRIWDARSGKLLCGDLHPTKEFEGDNFSYSVLAWTARGPMIVAAGNNPGYSSPAAPGHLYLWDASQVRAGKCTLQSRVVLADSTNRGLALAIAPDGRSVAGCDAKSLVFWDADNGHTRRVLPNVGAKDADYALTSDEPSGLQWSPDARRLLSRGRIWSSDGERFEVQVWDETSGNSHRLQGEMPSEFAFSPDGNTIAGGNVRLWNASSGKLLGGQDAPLASRIVRFSPDASTIIAGGASLIAWDAASLRALNGRVLGPLLPGGSDVKTTQGAQHADNYGFEVTRVGVKTNGRSVLRWQIRRASDRKVVGTLPEAIYYGDEGRATKAISADGRLLAVADWEGKTGNGVILLFDVRAQRVLPPLRVPKEAVNALRFSPDSQLLCGLSGNPGTIGTSENVAEGGPGQNARGRARVWRVRGGQLVARFPIGPDGFHVGTGTSVAIAFSPDSRRLALPGQAPGAPVNIWNLATGKRAQVLRSTDRLGVDSLSFAPDGRALAAGGSNVRVWDLRDGRLRRIYNLADEQGSTQYAWEVEFSRDGGTLFTSDEQGGFAWNVGWLRRPFRDEALRTLQNPVPTPDYSDGSGLDLQHGGLVFSFDGALLAAGGRGVRVWQVANGQLKRTLPANNPFGFSPDARTLFTDRPGGKTAAWSVATGRFAPPDASGALTQIKGAPTPADAPLAKIAAFRTTPVRVVDERGERLLHDWTLLPDWLLTSTFSADNRTLFGLISLPDSGLERVAAWELPGGKQRFMDAVGDSDLLELAVSPDGKRLAGANFYGFIAVWDAQSGALLHNLSGHSGAVTSVRFSPDGKTLGSAGQDGTVRLWDVSRGRQTRVYEGHSNTVTSVAFSLDGRLVASAGSDGTVKLWRAQP